MLTTFYIGWLITISAVIYYFTTKPQKEFIPYEDEKYITEVETW